MMRVWTLPTLLALCGALAAAGPASKGSPVTAAVVLLFFLALAAMNSPLIFPGSIGAQEAERRAEADGRPIVFWRPGCTYCMRLRLRLGRSAHRMHWVNIWHDPAGAAAVRAANNGNETVPTVVVLGTNGERSTLTNPPPSEVKKALER
ncbi:glutaredoxin domain-containing protein [Streptomyces sp. NPDC015144]|uniref:glutaredoxin domain-containing protein n=1 Tax=Streptomyces sp. NPDC015144 TaxID=3364944 RepID=UPI0036FDDC15